METTFTTKEAAEILKIKPASLTTAIWNNRVTPPKRHGRNYLWTIAYIESAAWAMGRFEQFKNWEAGK